MAPTYQLIASNTLTGTTASVTFSSIPSTYTDLVLRISARTDRVNPGDTVYIRFNSDSGTNYSTTRLTGTGSAVAAVRQSSSSGPISLFVTAASDTSNTFGNAEAYIPNYTLSATKSNSTFSVTENNGTTAYISANANLWNSTSAITSITLASVNSANFISGSSFFLYGISKS